ncbi:RcsF lipoprotein [Pseudidiomarina indica]|uniref:RcsF lipoprotein n=1 Tax=Pseudidiomarina indica TaxID=1159017 RepID=A0A1G6CTT1_9GAMM|nr:Rcs stress response system protein RcsF [Pseudidiomarina indica]SDB36308.1 RcsF lipoprotein [Pseudidiomarina indica]
MKRIFVALMVAFVAGCATSPATDLGIDMAVADSVTFMRPYELSRTDVNFTALGEVQGASCQVNRFAAEPTQQEALLRLKVAAAELGANHVVLRQCRQQQSDECRSQWLCTGDAFQSQPLR